MIITTRDDIDTWICDIRPDLGAYAIAVRDALQEDAHPPWGAEWGEYLASPHVAEIIRLVTMYDGKAP